jgi:hypothetical protein
VAIDSTALILVQTGAYPTDPPATLGETKVVSTAGLSDLDVWVKATAGTSDTIHVLGWIGIKGVNKWFPWASFTLDFTAVGTSAGTRLSPGGQVFSHVMLYRATTNTTIQTGGTAGDALVRMTNSR